MSKAGVESEVSDTPALQSNSIRDSTPASDIALVRVGRMDWLRQLKRKNDRPPFGGLFFILWLY